MSESRQPAREAHARRVFHKKLQEFLALDCHTSGSLTFHFQNGRLKKTEWNTVDPADQVDGGESS